VKLLIQRVTKANVVVDNNLFSQINNGLLVLIGIADDDDESKIEWLVNKLVNLRIFEDDEGKMNLSLIDKSYDILLISQFTLYADCSRGRRPDFITAAKPELAQDLYNKFSQRIGKLYKTPKLGVFGADMKVTLTNDGPVTIMLER
jgi:D-tyrosyl-tRNA(Tyr) deacylase